MKNIYGIVPVYYAHFGGRETSKKDEISTFTAGGKSCPWIQSIKRKNTVEDINIRKSIDITLSMK